MKQAILMGTKDITDWLLLEPFSLQHRVSWILCSKCQRPIVLYDTDGPDERIECHACRAGTPMPTHTPPAPPPLSLKEPSKAADLSLDWFRLPMAIDELRDAIRYMESAEKVLCGAPGLEGPETRRIHVATRRARRALRTIEQAMKKQAR